MSEKIYALLLWLYPSRFRQEYGEEALQVFRDRSRDEKGFVAKLRLWLDLFGDLAVSLASQYVHLQPELNGPRVVQSGDGAPCFFVLREGTPHPVAMCFGSGASIVALAIFWSLLGQAGRVASLSALVHSQPQGRFAPSPRQAPELAAPSTTTSTNSNSLLPTRSAGLDAAARHRVIGAAIAQLKRSYIDSQAAQSIAAALQAHERNGEYDEVTSGEALANRLTEDIRRVKNDTNLAVFFSSEPLPDQPPATTPESLAHHRTAMQKENCTLEKAEVLRNNIGYLKLNSFPEPSVCESTAAAAMTSMNQVDAIIFDLRDNRGGDPEMVQLLAAYLFDHPEYIYNPRENTSEHSWTRSPVAGNKLAGKPAYVLTSGSTASGAEQFCYNLKMLRRATLVGERTAGVAHSGAWHRIDEHFAMAVPEVRPINPYSKADWAGTGVEPDVRVEAAMALETAMRLAETKILKK